MIRISLVGLLFLCGCHAVKNRQYNHVNPIPLVDGNLKWAIRLWNDPVENNRTLVEEVYGGPISAWNTSAITSLEEAFLGLEHFQADLSAWDTSRVSNMRAAFYNTTGFTGQVGSWDVSNVKDMRVMLAFSSDFQDNISQWNTESLRNLRTAFTEYSNTEYREETLPISAWQTPNLLDMEGLFAGTHSFQTDLTGWTTSKVTSMAMMLERTVNFYGGDLSLLDTSRVLTMERMFENAINVRSGRKISEWDTRNVVSMDRIFFNATVDYTDDTPDDVFIFYLCWDLTALKQDSLSEAFCEGHSGGFNCDCVPSDMVRSINSGCTDGKKDRHCYGSLGEGKEDLPDADAEIDGNDTPLNILTSSSEHALCGFHWTFLLAVCASVAVASF